MLRFLRGASVLSLPLLSAALVGCGGGEKVDDIQDSEKVIQADKATQKAMEAYMRKGQGQPGR